MKRRNKYGNHKVVVGGVTFDSKGEYRRWADLLLLQRIGEITDLNRQTKFPIEINNVRVCVYVADYTYRKDGKFVVEDYKSVITAKDPVYRLKKRLLFAAAGITIIETGV